MKYRYSGKKLEECLNKAELDLSISRKKFDYKIIHEEKGIFKKKVTIEVLLKDNDNEEKNESDSKEKERKIVVTDEKILIKMLGEAEIGFSNDIKLFVNDSEVTSNYKVKASDKVTYKCEPINAIRNLKVSISKDKMEAKVSVEYIPEKEKKINAKFKYDGNIELTTELVDGKMPPLFTKDEIMQALKEKGVNFGIIDSEIVKVCNSKGIIDLLVAKGEAAVDDEDDKINVKFESSKRNVEVDSIQNVDYKNLYSIVNVKEGDIIAEIINGKEGHNGTNILGQEVKKKNKKLISVVIKDGCKLEGNKIIATIDGRPNIKKGVFTVNKVLETNSDVDIKSGNINFVGDILIAGSVKDGMKVKSGNSVSIEKNIESAEVLAQGDIIVKGSAINSQILGGADTIGLKEHVDFLKKFKREIELVIESVKVIRGKHVLSEKKADGEIVKLLLETKFRSIDKEAKEILKDNNFNSESMDKIKQFLREKIIGSGSLGIKYYDQLYELIKCIDNEIEPEVDKISCPVDIYLNYCQDTKVKTTGNIIITGKGQYVSNLSAEESIQFLTDGAVTRGGVLEAGKEIKAKVVGSVAGVTTTLKVPKDGVISADIAYQNSMFIIGERQYLLETPSKQVKAYMNSKGEIVVDKFVL